MSAVILRLPAAPIDCNVVRASINARAAATRVPDDTRQRALSAAFKQLRAGSSTAWAISQGNRELRGCNRATHTAPGGAA